MNPIFSQGDYDYKAACESELEARWAKDIADNPGEPRWLGWKDEAIRDNRLGKCKTFVVVCGREPVGTGTLLLSPCCGAIACRKELADGINAANINALRMDKAHEGKGHMSRLVKVMEAYAKDLGYKALTIGVEAAETRNLAIYLHWGYDKLILHDIEDGALVLYYSKHL
ncbi:MAG: GNAT family N-acetyltransferase [Christensenellales bacterium]|jgi:GNAT superfamily N-acetyltransferase